MTTITVDATGLDAVIARFEAMPAQIDRATSRAIRKTAGWVATQARKEIAGELGVAQKIIANRLATRSTGKTGLVWFGLNPVAVSDRRFANLKQENAGARAGRLRFPGAFIARMPNGVTGAFRRVGRARLPIRMETLPIDTPAVRAIIAAQADKARTRAAEVLVQELNYEINVRGAR